ncbi:MAG: hypothetical protein AB7P76_08110 [Candidatus Melainabacteria bacterium]
MSDASTEKQSKCPMKKLKSIDEITWALMILKLFLGLRFIHAFWGKLIGESGVPALGNLAAMAQSMTTMFQGKLPAMLVSPYAFVLPWVELTLGLMLLTCFYSRTVLVLTGFTYVSLAFGMMLQGNYNTVSDIALHILMVATALILLKHAGCKQNACHDTGSHG